jgi:hypothetical protein
MPVKPLDIPLESASHDEELQLSKKRATSPADGALGAEREGW